MFNDFILPTLRQALQFGAGIMLSKGVIDASMAEIFVGAGVSIATLIWMAYARRNAPKQP